ncbi:MAG: homoserine kinase [Actinomycetota bacterium]
MSNLEGKSVRVRVPATSANLGPGFDTLGIALSYYDDLEVTAIADGKIIIEVEGEGKGQVPQDGSHLVVRAITKTFELAGQPLPGLHLKAVNRIPHGRGMGSSGAAVVAGIMAAKGLLSGTVEITDKQMLDLATELENHPDNVAPALFGGLSIAWEDESGPHTKKLSVHRGVSPLVLVPSTKMSTALARSMQPESVPHEDAVFNVSRSALLVAAMVQSPELLLAATEDRLHQNYRAAAMPETDALIQLLRANGHAAVVSGAGPSVLVLASDPAMRIRAKQLAEQHYPQWLPLLLAVDNKGATLEIHQKTDGKK